MNMFSTVAKSRKPGAGAGSAAGGSSLGGMGGRPGSSEGKDDSVPDLETFLSRHDYLGACTLLQFQQQTGDGNATTLPWLAYSAFHLGDYKRALETYQTMIQQTQDSSKVDGQIYLNQACCMYYLGQYKEAIETAKKGPATRLQNRILMHCYYKVNDEDNMKRCYGNLTDDHADLMSGAALSFARGQYQNALDEFRRISEIDRDLPAVCLAMAFACYRLDHFKISNDLTSDYLAKYPDSATATNLRACNMYRLMQGSVAELDIKGLLSKTQSSTHTFESDMIRHNLVVFRGGEDALTHLPPLLDVVPEALFNLVSHHLKRNNVDDAYKLVKDLEPATPQDFIIKAVTMVSLGLEIEADDLVAEAKKLFISVGESASERDTIPGRKCMSQVHFLNQDWSRVVTYLGSIEQYCSHESSFNYNYGIALANLDRWDEAQAHLLEVKDPNILASPTYLSWMLRTFVMNHEAAKAWTLYTENENPSPEMLSLLAADCYRVGEFFYAFRAYDALFRVDPSQEHWEGKKGAACGVLQMVIAGRERKDALREVIAMMSKHDPPNPQADLITRVMARWAQENGINMS